MDKVSLSYDLEYLNQISNNDKEFMLDMIQTFIQIAPESIEEMKLHLNNKSYTELGRAAHKFAPTFQRSR